MKKKDKLSVEPVIIPVVINGKKYYTWPQTQHLTHWDRDRLRKEMKKMNLEPFAIEPHYLFVKCDDYIKMTEGVAKQSATETIQGKLSTDKLNKLAFLVEGNNPELEKLLKMLETDPDKTTPKKK